QPWVSSQPVAAVWGVWKGRGLPTHSFRFVTMAEGGYATSLLTNRITAFGPGEFAGLFANSTNPPGMLLKLRVFEETNGYPSGPVTDFLIKNDRLIAQRSRHSKGYTVAVNIKRWRFSTQYIIANEDGPRGILVERIYSIGPVRVCQKF